MYKFGNYICKLREERGLTQAELADMLDVTDKSVSKWENGQAFPRIETFEKLAFALATSVEDILSASKDGVNRICVSNNFGSVLQIDVSGQLYAIRADESKWVEIKSDTAVIKITGEIFTESDFEEIKNAASNLTEKVLLKIAKKVAESTKSLILQADCTYKISNIAPDSFLTVELDSFDLGDKALTYNAFTIAYPEIICDGAKIELLNARGKNSKEVIKKYKKLGLQADAGMNFLDMILAYPLRDIYFRHLCKPEVLKKNILNAETHKQKSQKRNKIGCFGAGLILLCLCLGLLFYELAVSPIVTVETDKPYLVAADYSKITYYDDVYVRIDALPENAEPTLFFGATVWEDTRTDGLSKIEQSNQDNMVMLYEDENGNKYLWLVENYSEVMLGGEDKSYDDFDEHYVYMYKNQK